LVSSDRNHSGYHEDFPPDDGDFDPNNFHFLGFGQPGNGPPPPQQPPPPDMEHLQALGWGEWSQPAPNAQQDEIVPGLIPIQPDADQEVAHQEPVEKVMQAVQQVATPDQAPQGQVLAMDDITDSSEDESPPPPPPLLLQTC